MWIAGGELAHKGQIILFQAAIGRASVGGFASFAMIEIQRHMAAGIVFLAAVIAAAAIYKDFRFVHD